MTPDEFREARRKLGLSQSQLAAVLGYSGGLRISFIERGERNAGTAVVRLMRAYLEGYRPEDWPGE